MNTIRKFIPNAITKSTINDQYDFIGSTEDPDRDGDIIRLDGWDTTNFEKNNVCFYGHDYRGNSVKFPIGTATVTKDVVNRRLLFSVTFSKSFEDAQTVKALVDEGILKATSVGFIAKEGGMSLMVDPETGAVVGREFNGQELLELSIVPLPANPNAVRLALSKGICTEAKATAWGLFDTKDDAPTLAEHMSVGMQSLSDRLTALESSMKRWQSGVVMESVVGAGSTTPTAAEQQEPYYTELLTLGRSLADYLHPTATPVATKLAEEAAALFKR